MKNKPILTVMLTYNDVTVKNAYEIFEKCKKSLAEYWGFKEEALPLEQMKRLYAYMKENGKKTVFEVVAYDEEKSIEGAKMAVECGCDILMGTLFCDTINDICKANGIKYMPFVGNIYDRPSILDGDIDKMIAEAKAYIDKGAYGIDLLGYRYTGDAEELIKRFVKGVNAPVCVAGSVNSYERLDEIKSFSPWSFTIGSAFFENKFGSDFCEQINNVCDYISDKHSVAARK